jgi:hypothetical protein
MFENPTWGVKHFGQSVVFKSKPTRKISLSKISHSTSCCLTAVGNVFRILSIVCQLGTRPTLFRFEKICVQQMKICMFINNPFPLAKLSTYLNARCGLPFECTDCYACFDILIYQKVLDCFMEGTGILKEHGCFDH